MDWFIKSSTKLNSNRVLSGRRQEVQAEVRRYYNRVARLGADGGSASRNARLSQTLGTGRAVPILVYLAMIHEGASIRRTLLQLLGRGDSFATLLVTTGA